ncbi:hypothetical protein Y032_0643g1062 [Ancylostoma ceylanicum]|nr:hypothetical protein Y032_0643g1062 [Ancylostoma ceylanicum]
MLTRSPDAAQTHAFAASRRLHILFTEETHAALTVLTRASDARPTHAPSINCLQVVNSSTRKGKRKLSTSFGSTKFQMRSDNLFFEFYTWQSQ